MERREKNGSTSSREEGRNERRKEWEKERHNQKASKNQDALRSTYSAYREAFSYTGESKQGPLPQLAHYLRRSHVLYGRVYIHATFSFGNHRNHIYDHGESIDSRRLEITILDDFSIIFWLSFKLKSENMNLIKENVLGKNIYIYKNTLSEKN